jgi:hypothetical protein
MSKVVIDLGISLDGFIAGPDDDPGKVFDWYFSGDTPTLSTRTLPDAGRRSHRSSWRLPMRRCSRSCWTTAEPS